MDVYDQADLYCAAFAWPLDREVDWLLSQVGDVQSVLEPFCGHARYAQSFAERGVKYTGLDNSRAMLARAHLGPNITLVHADATKFEIPNQSFDLGWCPVNSLAHLTGDDDVLAHARCMRRSLRSGALYIVELELVSVDGPCVNDASAKNTWSMPQPDGSVVHASWLREDSDRAMRRCHERATFKRTMNGQVIQQISTCYTMRMWTLDDLQRLCQATDFALERAHVHQEKRGNPGVHLSADIENNGANTYFFLRAI